MTRRKALFALVLGERAIAEALASQLREEGIEPWTQSMWMKDRLPSLGDTFALPKMRSILNQFAEAVRGFEGMVHPGTTLWGERPELPSLCKEAGLRFLGPSPRVLSAFSDRLNFLLEAEKFGIPNLILCNDPMHSVREIERWVEQKNFRFPFVIKAVKGAGNRGITVVQDLDSLRRDIPIWIEQLRHFQGEVLFFLERYLEGARQIVVPFARFQDGRKVIFPTVDASLQCRYRKVVEFCPALQVDDEVVEQLHDWTRRLADRYGYVGVGSFEFLVDGSRAFLIYGTPRLNTDYILWSAISRTRAPSWQLATHGLALAPEFPSEGRGSIGVLARLYAEDSLLHLPQPGVIEKLSEFSRPGDQLRANLNLNYTLGDEVSSRDSGFLGQLIVESTDRNTLCADTLEVLKEICIEGSLGTNLEFLKELFKHPWVKEEMFHAGFIDEDFFPAIQPNFFRKRTTLGNKNVMVAATTGKVHALLFRPGMAVRAHEPLVIIESLGLFVPHSLPVPVLISSWEVAQWDEVVLGQPLVQIQFLQISENL